MARTMARGLTLAIACMALVGLSTQARSANPDLFYNYYVGPSPNVGGVPAQAYLSPRPVPPLVGHTYITYQAMMPHEYLHRHHRTYYRYHPSGGFTRTRICWW